MPVIHIVDDAMAILQVAERGLNRYGYSVRTFNSAMAYIDEEPPPPDVLVVDLMMSGMNGVALCQHLRGTQEYARVPIVVITGMVDRSGLMSDEALIREFGVKAVLIKPFALRELRAKVEEAVQAAPAPDDDEFDITYDEEPDGYLSHVLLYGFDPARRASLDARLAFFESKRIEITFINEAAALLEAARHHSEALKLVVIDAATLDDAQVGQLADIANVALAFLGMHMEVPPGKNVIRAGSLMGDDLAGALVDWLGLQERMSVRVEAAGPVELHVGEMSSSAVLRDLSDGGLCVAGVRDGLLPLPAMSLQVSFALAGYGEIRRAECFVRWIKPGPSDTAICGVSFARPIADDVQELVSRYIKEAAGHETTQKITPLFRKKD